MLDLVIQPVFMPSTPIPRKVEFRGQMISPTGYHFGRNGAPFHEWTPAQTVGESTADTEWDYMSSSDPPLDRPDIQEDRWKRAAFMRFGFTDRRDMATNAGRDAEPPIPDSGGSLPPNREWKEKDLADDALWALFKRNIIPMYLLGRGYGVKAENINSAAFDAEQREAHRLRVGQVSDFAQGTTLQQEISRKTGLVDKRFGSADLMIFAHASSMAMAIWACCDQGFRISFTTIDALRNVLMHWTDGHDAPHPRSGPQKVQIG